MFLRFSQGVNRVQKYLLSQQYNIEPPTNLTRILGSGIVGYSIYSDVHDVVKDINSVYWRGYQETNLKTVLPLILSVPVGY